ncbi:MAG: RNA polymerase sigma factor [Deltaproteobacteria bacterium]
MSNRSEAEVVCSVRLAIGGDRDALESVVVHIQTDVYNLAVRMLWCPDDAADATQEILMKVVTRLASFRGDSAFRTWVYRIAANHLLDVRRSRVERERLTFSSFGESLRNGASDPPAGWESDPEQRLLLEEVKIGCTTAMLLCLTRDERIAYILGDVFEFSSDEAAAVLSVSAAAFRQRLSRARAALRAFMAAECGLVADAAPCRCRRRVRAAVATGRARADRPLFTLREPSAARELPVISGVDEMDELHRIAGIFRSHPTYQAPGALLDAVRGALASGRFSIVL